MFEDEYDVYVYIGDIERRGHLEITKAIDERKSKYGLKEKVLFCLATFGGDPDAGYRIGRALQHNYENITILIVGPCKSAGTLVVIAAHELIIGDMGELGPLDIQLKKNDEIGESSSGLVIQTALDELKDCAISAFGSYLINIKMRNQLSTRMSADIAARLTKAIVAPMSSQIDPIKLGEHQRAMTIALSYGNRLDGHSKNLKNGSLRTLIAGYPAHGFVIDRKEARELFHRVSSPSDGSDILNRIIGSKISEGTISINGTASVLDFTHVKDESREEVENDGGNDKGDGGIEPTSGEAAPAKPKSRQRSSGTQRNPEQATGAKPENPGNELEQ